MSVNFKNKRRNPFGKNPQEEPCKAGTRGRFVSSAAWENMLDLTTQMQLIEWKEGNGQKQGFWPHKSCLAEHLNGEVREVLEAKTAEEVADECGDVLFTAIYFALMHTTDLKACYERCVERIRRRLYFCDVFSSIASKQGGALSENERTKFWPVAKASEKLGRFDENAFKEAFGVGVREYVIEANGEEFAALGGVRK